MQNLLINGQAETAAPEWRDNCRKRWGFDPLEPVPVENPFAAVEDEDAGSTRYITGEEMLYKVADNTCKGSPEDASRKILQDFRSGRMGPICLQVAPIVNNSDDDNDSEALQDFSAVPDPRMGTMRTVGMQPNSEEWEHFKAKQEAEQLERAQMARETAKEIGLELPPKLENPSNKKAPEDVGKGMFDGW
jgi:hypothetical protein